MEIPGRPKHTEPFCMKNHPVGATAWLSTPASNEGTAGNWWRGHGDGCPAQTRNTTQKGHGEARRSFVVNDISSIV